MTTSVVVASRSLWPVSETGTVRVGFADAGAQLQGVAIEGAGALLALGDRVQAAPAPTLVDVDGAACRLDGASAYQITLEPLGPPAELGPATRVWICRARGTVGDRALDGLGSIMRSLADHRIVLERAVTAWFGPAEAVALAARRPRRASGHGDEELVGAILRGEPLEPITVADPRLSSTYDGEGLILRCGIELWETDEAEFAERYGGIAGLRGELTGTDGDRTAVAFMSFRGDRERGVGQYLITER
jgi:hypothetical protein